MKIASFAKRSFRQRGDATMWECIRRLQAPLVGGGLSPSESYEAPARRSHQSTLCTSRFKTSSASDPRAATRASGRRRRRGVCFRLR